MKTRIMKLLRPNKYKREHVFDKDDRKVKVIRTGDLSWRIVYADDAEIYSDEGTTAFSELLGSKK
jgi:hypothetical protein